MTAYSHYMFAKALFWYMVDICFAAVLVCVFLGVIYTIEEEREKR